MVMVTGAGQKGFHLMGAVVRAVRAWIRDRRAQECRGQVWAWRTLWTREQAARLARRPQAVREQVGHRTRTAEPLIIWDVYRQRGAYLFLAVPRGAPPPHETDLVWHDAVTARTEAEALARCYERDLHESLQVAARTKR